jgi:cytochrome c peroxidase
VSLNGGIEMVSISGQLPKLLSLLLLCVSPVSALQSLPQRESNFARPISTSPRGISESLRRKRIPQTNPMSPRKVTLGQALFFDKRLSVDGTVSCASCHDPAFAFTDSKVLAEGAGDKRGARNTPTILNAVFSDSLFWDGRARSLEEQVKHPLLSSFEMSMVTEELTNRLSAIPEYRRQFRQVFNSEVITIDTIAKAIAAYERTLLSGNSPFDRFITGNNMAISDAQKRGWELFKGKAKCIECHIHSQTNPLFTDFKFHNTGIAATDTLFEKLLQGAAKSSTETTLLAHSEGLAELGRFAITRQRVDIGAFKTPTIRDVELTSPYMHNGSLKTLIDVVQFYNRGGNANSHLDKLMQPLHLNDNEVNDLVQFMRALTSDDVLKLCQTSNPQTRTAVQVK